MTHPTKAVLQLLLGDYLRLLNMKNAKPEDILYTEAGLQSCIEKIKLINYHQTVTMMAAKIPAKNPDVLVVESTYRVQLHQSCQEREARFTGTVDRVVTRGGRCLVPVFALGRAQELLLILDKYWQANPHLQNSLIYSFVSY